MSPRRAHLSEMAARQHEARAPAPFSASAFFLTLRMRLAGLRSMNAPTSARNSPSVRSPANFRIFSLIPKTSLR